MDTALQVLNVVLMEMLSAQRKLLAAGLVQYTPVFFILVRFYGMLQKRAKGGVLDWDWQGWLEDIEDDDLRLRLRIALENDEALRSGGLPAELETRRAKRGASHVRRRHEANRAS